MSPTAPDDRVTPKGVTLRHIQASASYRQAAAPSPTVELEIRRRSPLHVILLALGAVGAVIVVWRWVTRFRLAPTSRIFEVPLTVGTAFLVLLVVAAVAGLLAHDRITLRGGELEVAPWMRGKRVVATGDITQLFAAEQPLSPVQKVMTWVFFFGRWVRPRRFLVGALGTDGAKTTLLGGLTDPEVARFVERTLEEEMGLEQSAVPDELPEKGIGLGIMRFAWSATLVAGVALGLLGSGCVGVAVGEVAATEEWQELPLRLAHDGPMVFWAEVDLRGKAHSLSRSDPSATKGYVTAEIELMRNGEVAQRLTCNPLRVTWNRYSMTTAERWQYDGPIFDCLIKRVTPGPQTIRVRLVRGHQIPEISDARVVIVPKV